MSTSTTPPPTGSNKADPDAMALRASPRPVTRLNRRMLAVLAGTLGAVVLGGTLWSLQSHKRERNAAAELYNVDRVSHAENLDKCLATMVEGFQAVIDRLSEKPVAISFAFPGPADYPNGIIGGYLPNFPSFREGVALGPFLEAKFGIPVYINNDGDLFAYGEALGGALPEVNARLEALGSPKKYKNLVGYTFGTGLGVGLVIDNRLNRGDNSCVETFCLRHKKMPEIIPTFPGIKSVA